MKQAIVGFDQGEMGDQIVDPHCSTIRSSEPPGYGNTAFASLS
jgi:hypothetical protein